METGEREVFRFTVFRSPEGGSTPTFGAGEQAPSRLLALVGSPVPAESPETKYSLLYMVSAGLETLTWRAVHDRLQEPECKERAEELVYQALEGAARAGAGSLDEQDAKAAREKIAVAIKDHSFNAQTGKLYEAWLKLVLANARRGRKASDSEEVDSTVSSRGQEILETALCLAACLRQLARQPATIAVKAKMGRLLRRPRVDRRVIEAAAVRAEPQSAATDGTALQNMLTDWRGLIARLTKLNGDEAALPALPSAAGSSKPASVGKPASALWKLWRQNELLARYVSIRDAQRLALAVLPKEPHPRSENPVSPPVAMQGAIEKAWTGLFGVPALKTQPGANPPNAPALPATTAAAQAKNRQQISSWLGLPQQTTAQLAAKLAAEIANQGFSESWAHVEEEKCKVLVELQGTYTVLTPTIPRLLVQEWSALTQTALDQALDKLPYRVVGFQDLIRATERFIDNDARELAHIENQAGGEERERVHILTESSETEQVTEEEEETQETRDLETSSQSSLQMEAQRQIQKELSVDAGLRVSGTYGTVTAEVTADVHYGITETQSQRVATNYAKNVIDKSVNSLRKRTRRQSLVRTIRTIEERNRHLFRADSAQSLIYLWVERIQEISLKRYGKRLLLEFIVPEPGAYLAYKYLTNSATSGPPREFTETAAEINELNYLPLAHRYGADGVVPPPPEYLTISGAEKLDDEKGVKLVVNELKIPAGYVPDVLQVTADSYYLNGWVPSAPFQLSFGGRAFATVNWPNLPYVAAFNFNYQVPAAIAHELDATNNAIYVGLEAPWGHHGAIFNATLVCRRSCRAYTAWQIETHDKIRAAAKAAIAEYQDQVRANPMGRTVGGSPLLNRETEKQELKRYAMAILNREPIKFDLFPEWGAQDQLAPPELPDLAEIPKLRAALDRFEESLEWMQATFKLYPAYWGSSDQWLPRAKFAVNDLQHRMFLEAGAARLVVPVAPGRERAVLNWLVERDRALLEAFAGQAGGPELTAEDVYSDILDEIPEADPNEPIWIRTLVDTNEDLVRGSDTLDVKQGSADVTVNSPEADVFSPFLDKGREIWIDAANYTIQDVTVDGTKLVLDRPFSGSNAAAAKFVVSAQVIGKPWRVRVPTPMVVLGQFKHQIKANYQPEPDSG